jgi:hypothetical protein
MENKLINIDRFVAFIVVFVMFAMCARELDGGNIGEQGPLGRGGVKIWIK